MIPKDNGSLTMMEINLGTDSDSDSKPDGYIVLCRTFHTHYTNLDSDLYSYFCIKQESESVPESVSSNVNEPLHGNA